MNLYNRVSALFANWFSSPSNLEFVGSYHHQPGTVPPNPSTQEAHKRFLHNVFKQHLFTYELDYIENEHRRSEATPEAIENDFFANDVEPHDIPFDVHVEIGLQCMTDAFRPPVPCLPAHLNDVEHHYPFKWQVNAEPPFSTDSYFLDNRKLFSDYYDTKSQTWRGYVDPFEANRRYQHTKDKEGFLNQTVPAKFGFMKDTIFSWTRRWHHIIKEGFQTATNLSSTAYLRDRFIFPMLLHTKTAIVKKDDPDKMRTIWGCSKPWIIADTMFYWEYIAWIKKHPGVTPMLWGYETMTGGWMRLNSQLFSSYLKKSYVTLDWSRFDKRAYFKLILAIMCRVRTFLDFDNGYLPNVNYPDTRTDWSPNKAQRLERLWLWTLECLIKSPIVLPDGRMYIRHYAGIPSGLFITQLLDSWYNYTMICTILSSIGLNPKHCIIKVQGDDSIVRLGVLIPPEAHEAFLLALQSKADFYFKAIISVDKSELGNSLNNREVLSYRNYNGLPRRDEIKMLAQFYHTKARNPTPEIAMAQAVGFAYASCGTHQRVLDALEHVYTDYKDAGYTPNRAGLSLVFGNSPDIQLPHYDIDHFPSIEEIKRFLTCNSYDNSVQMAKSWPNSYFISEPCERM
nr:putative RNA-dependent RNA polymerase [Rhizoctonia solani partitivirus 2]